jgi:RNA polymerase sigma-70 factor (ECF subfamily)
MIGAGDNILIEKINRGDEKAFETLFHRYYKSLCVFASAFVKDDNVAEEVIQDLFVKLWEDKHRVKIDTSVKNYLLRSTKNKCINYLKHNQIKNRYAQHILSDSGQNFFEENYVEIDLLKKIEESINSLPEKRKEIFRLSREEGLKYREIAEKLNISIKTVETQMGLSIKTLREKLKDYEAYFTLLFFFNNIIN